LKLIAWEIQHSGSVDMERRPPQFRLPRFFRHFCRGERGASATELALILPIFLLLVFGVLEFGHAWYMRQMLSNASREGARYGTRYQTNSSGTRKLPSSLTPSIAHYIQNSSSDNGGNGGYGLSALLPSDANLTVTVSGAGFTESNVDNLPGEDLTVKVGATKNWLVLGSLISTFGTSKNIAVTTTMKCE
jgi:Flp pilus assembly protein TadG